MPNQLATPMRALIASHARGGQQTAGEGLESECGMTERKTDRARAALTFWSRTLTVAAMLQVVGTAPDVSAEAGMARWGARVGRDTAYLEWNSMVEGEPDLDAAVRQLFERATTIWDGLVALSAAADACQLGLSMHTEVATDSSPGFGLDESHILLLAELGAGVDFEVFMGAAS